MSYEQSAELVNYEIVDALRELQHYINDIDDPYIKRGLFHEGVKLLPIRDSHFQTAYSLTSSEVIARSPDLDEDERIIADRPLSFVGRMRQIGYMQDLRVPVDSIAVVFDRAKIFARAEDELDAMIENPELFRVQALRVPVLAIESWERAESLL